MAHFIEKNESLDQLFYFAYSIDQESRDTVFR